MLINEGIVDITPAEEKNIELFARKLSFSFNNRQRIHKEDPKITAHALIEYANFISPEYGLDGVEWTFTFDSGTRTKAACTGKEIIVNLYHSIQTPPESYSSLYKKKKSSALKIDISKILHSIFHEWVHFKQFLLYKASTGEEFETPIGWNARDKYYKRPWEQMAFAREEIEWIKRHQDRIKSEEILRWIKKWGLVRNEQIYGLKKNDPESYNKIMKYAAMFVMKMAAQQALSKKKSAKPTSRSLPIP